MLQTDSVSRGNESLMGYVGKENDILGLYLVLELKSRLYAEFGEIHRS